MNKGDLVARIAKNAELTKRQSEKVVDVLLGSVQEALCKGEHVTLVGFGTFGILSRTARQGRNPRTGQLLMIPAHKTPKFIPGKRLREALK